MLVGITSVNQNQIDQFIEDTGVTYPILQDQSSGGLGGFGGVVYDDYYIPNQGSPYPRDFIIDQNGILVYANNEVDTDYMLYIIDELLIEEDIVGIQNDDYPIYGFNILSVYPNPFNPIVTIEYDLHKTDFVTIMVYDMIGNVVSTLVNQNQNSGYKSVQWNATNDKGQPVSAGVYLYSIEVEEFRQAKKMILLK